jgi:glyoxylase-like metal-dependent hydrolase (beta-lactamase superfamily II)
MPNHNKLSVRVRMYRQGLGDCFLLTFTRGQEIFNLLIDCGIFFLTKNGAKIMTQVAESLRDSTDKHLNAVALTHDHYDHTSGFGLAKKVFDEKEFKLDEVWVGWTEDENHAKYKAIREHFSNILKGLRTALNAELQEADEKLRETVHSLVNDFITGHFLISK